MHISTPQIQPITTFVRDHRTILAKLQAGPVFLTQYSQPTAVLLSLSQWQALVAHIHQLEQNATSQATSRAGEQNASTLCRLPETSTLPA